MSQYQIWGEYQGEAEVIDEAKDEDDAKYLMNNYQLAFGDRWYIWYKECDNAETDMDAD